MVGCQYRSGATSRTARPCRRARIPYSVFGGVWSSCRKTDGALGGGRERSAHTGETPAWNQCYDARRQTGDNTRPAAKSGTSPATISPVMARATNSPIRLPNLKPWPEQALITQPAAPIGRT